MRKTWNSSSVQIFHSTISAEEYNQILDEWAEVVYRHLCQLSDDLSAVPDNLTAAPAAERTGTHG